MLLFQGCFVPSKLIQDSPFSLNGVVNVHPEELQSQQRSFANLLYPLFICKDRPIADIGKSVYQPDMLMPHNYCFLLSQIRREFIHNLITQHFMHRDATKLNLWK